MSKHESTTQTTDLRSFPRIKARPLGSGRIGLVISQTEYVLTPLDVHALQNAVEWALKREVSKA